MKALKCYAVINEYGDICNFERDGLCVFRSLNTAEGYVRHFDIAFGREYHVETLLITNLNKGEQE